MQLASLAVTLFTGSEGDFNPVGELPVYPAYRPLLKLLNMLLRMKIRSLGYMPVAMGANIGGVIVSAIACGVFIATIGLVK